MNLRSFDPHQVTAKRFVYNHTGIAGLGMAPGTGKTIVAIRTADLPCLVICRRDDFLTWKQELYLEGYFDESITFIDSGQQGLPEELELNHWYIVTYDLVKPFVRHKKVDEDTGETTQKAVKRTGVMDWVMSHQFAQIIWDEFHYTKRWESARTKANYKATRHIPRRLGLTGTVITNHVLDVFSLCLLLDNGRLFGDNPWRFRQRYYLKSGKGWYQRKDAKEKVKEKMRKLWFYVHEDDVLDLPPCRPVVKGVPMTGMQRRHYEQVLTDWETDIGNGVHIEFDQVIVQLMKLRQIASGFIYDENKTAHWFRNNKMPFLFKMMTDPDYWGETPKIIVWAAHTAELHRMCQEAEERNIKHVLLSGSNHRLNNAARQQFRDDKKTRLFFGQVDKGVGMNELIIADTAFWYSNSLKVVSKEQSRRRNRRRGSNIHRRIHQVTLCTEGTLDFALAKSIQAAMNLAHEIMSACKAGESIRHYVT